jgi:hypothetical protein
MRDFSNSRGVRPARAIETGFIGPVGHQQHREIVGGDVQSRIALQHSFMLNLLSKPQGVSYPRECIELQHWVVLIQLSSIGQIWTVSAIQQCDTFD